MKDAIGIPEGQLRKSAKSAVCKTNIDSDGRLVVTAMVRKALNDNPEAFDPRQYLRPARTELAEMIKRKNKKVLGSAGRAREVNVLLKDSSESIAISHNKTKSDI